MKLYKLAERGQALVVIALAAVVLFGFAALAIDGSAKFSDRRHAQNAADTAAIAAALAKVNAQTSGLTDSPVACPDPSPSQVCAALQLAGLDRAASNGYNNNLTSNTVEIYSPPISGYYSGKAEYVQVIITSHVKTYFARVIGVNETMNIVSAVSLTKKGGPLFNGAAVVSLDPNPSCGSGSVNVGGNGTINLTGGGFFVNSNASCGYSQTSCSVILNISSGGISSAGSPIDIHGCSGSGLTTNTTQTQVVVPDEIYMPDKPTECTQTPQAAFKVGSVWHLNPGYYAAFPPSSLGNGKDIVMESGVYCVGSSISWGGNDFNSLTGTSGVTIYITTGNDFGFNINSSINLDASNSGDYAGYLVILDGKQSNLQNCTINGGGNIVLNGTIFMPYCNVTINGNSSSAAPFNAQVIAYDVKLNGNNTITFTYNPGDNAKNQRKVGLMK